MKIFIHNSNHTNQTIEIVVCNILGDEIYKSKILVSSIEIDLSDAPGGIYFLKANNQSSQIATQKIIIQ